MIFMILGCGRPNNASNVPYAPIIKSEFLEPVHVTLQDRKFQVADGINVTNLPILKSGMLFWIIQVSPV